MPVCPKCGFDGLDPDSCERCGIIYARMHTIMEPRPAALTGALNQQPSGPVRPLQTPISSPAIRPPPKVEEADTNVDLSALIDEALTAPDLPTVAPTKPPAGRVVPVLAEAFPGMQPMPTPAGGVDRSPSYTTRPPIELTKVPIVPPPERKSRAPLLIGMLVAALVAWGIDKWMDYRNHKFSVASSDTQPIDPEYFHFTVNELIDDARRQFREIKDLDRAKKQREEMSLRVRHLKSRVVTATFADEKKGSIDRALDEVLQFLRNDVDPILAALEAEKAQTDELSDPEVAEATPGEEAKPAESPAPTAEAKQNVDAKPAVAAEAPAVVAAEATPSPAPVNRKPSTTALNRAVSAIAALKVE